MRAAWQDYLATTHEGDAAALRELLADEVAPELDGPEAEIALEMRRALLPAEPAVTQIEIQASQAFVDVEGLWEGQPITGRITFVREAGSWKVLKEAWNVDMSVEPAAGGRTRSPIPKPNVVLAKVYDDGESATPEARTGVEAHEGGVRELAFTPDGARLVSISYDDMEICLWDAQSVELLDQVDTEERPNDMAMLPDGSAVYVVDADGRITRWPLLEDKFGEPQGLAGLAGQASRIAIDAAGRTAVTTSWNEPAKLWDLAQGRYVRALPKSEKMRGVSFSPIAARVACGSHADYFAVWNLERLSWPVGAVNKHKVPRVSEQSDVHSVVYSPDGRRLATGHMDTSISIWDMEKGRQLHNWYVRDASVMDVAFSPCSTVLATAQQDGKVHLWETETHRKLCLLEAHEGAALSLAFNPADGVTFASGGEDGTIWIWQ